MTVYFSHLFSTAAIQIHSQHLKHDQTFFIVMFRHSQHSAKAPEKLASNLQYVFTALYTYLSLNKQHSKLKEASYVNIYGELN